MSLTQKELGAVRELVRIMAITYEQEQPCHCQDLPSDFSIMATGHKTLCPVDTAVRVELVKAGVI